VSGINPRYVAYARSHGNDPDDQLVADIARWPGGRMTGFLTWMSARWSEWETETGHTGTRTDADQVAFDAWLAERTDRIVAHVEALARDPKLIVELAEMERQIEAGTFDPGEGLTADEFRAKYLEGGAK